MLAVTPKTLPLIISGETAKESGKENDTEKD